MKLNLTLVSLLALILACSLAANAEDALEFDNTLTSQPAQTEPKNTMTWPMLPGESVNDLARMFYPNSKAMQQQFVAKTLRLNSETEPNLNATKRFEAPALLVVPTLKSLSKKSANVGKKSNKSLKMSYGLKQAVENIPAKLLQEYEVLVNKNVFLKEQLLKLNEKIVFLQAKLDDLKLIFDKTLTLPTSDLPVADPIAGNTIPTQASVPVAIAPVINTPDTSTAVISPAAEPATSPPATKKVFKNLNKPQVVPDEPVKTSFLDSFNMDFVKAALAIVAVLLLGAFALKKYRQRMFAQLSFAATKMQNTVTDYSGYFEKTKLEKTEPGPETIQHQQAAQEIESRLSATLEEAKLLMSVNRGADAIAHLKMTIESQPKASINHWLYLLEVFRKLNLKDEFEQYADSLHETFNVMTPIWYEKLAETTQLVVPQSLEEFPHILEQLYGVWPGELAGVYLRSLITDNRGGERVGFGKSVVNEILFLIELLDTYKDIPN